MARIIIAGTHSGSGKTTVVLGILAALMKRGVPVQPFKIGPDYIDPGFHTLAAGRTSRNIDSWILSSEQIKGILQRNIPLEGVGIIEGVMGLFDGSREGEKGSSAHMALMTNTPVVLVINGGGMAQSAAAVAFGFKNIEPKIHLAGIIFNNLGSESHYQILKQAVEVKVGIPVLGYLPRNKVFNLGERHLGLIPAVEQLKTKSIIGELTLQAEKTLNLEELLTIARNASPLEAEKMQRFKSKSKVSIAFALDQAFNFYYQENLEALEELGAKLRPFSPLNDAEIPKGVGAIYLGGGFPEVFAEVLAKNQAMLGSIHRAAAAGMPIYAECGGFMYLMAGIKDKEGRFFPQAHVFPHVVTMGDKLKSLGYCKVQGTSGNFLLQPEEEARGHEFHYSSLAADGEKAEAKAPAFMVKKMLQQRGGGLIYKRVVASYYHLHFYSNPKIPARLVQAGWEFLKR